jgi:nucleobase:cation symporter-1, NCS1 family
MSHEATSGGHRSVLKIEQHSIDFIPESERHGKPWQQLPFWFGNGVGLTSAGIGFIGPSLGLGLAWSVVAVVTGMAFGTVFMALHANQGPRLGLPQMIQSRAQFGSRGVVLPLVLAVFIYVSFIVATALFTRSAFNHLFNTNAGIWFYPLFIAVVIIIAIYGFDWVHAFNRWAGYSGLAFFIAVNVLLVLYTSEHGVHEVAAKFPGFSWTPFLVQFAAAAGYQIAFAIFTADYTRYLPSKTSAPKVIGFVFSGATLGPAWSGALGSVVASYFAQPDPIGSFQDFGNHELSGFGTALIAFTLVCFVIGLTPLAYGAMLDSITAIDSIKRIRPSANWRIGAAVFVFIVSSIIACAVPDNLVADYNTLVTLILYLIIPWTAINLTDYYFIRRGKYVISELVKTDGIYGEWNWRGLTAYAIGAASMVPFYNLSFYEGPATSALGGADISFIVGIAVSALVYYTLAHGTETTERQLVRDEQRTHTAMVSSFDAPEPGTLATE